VAALRATGPEEPKASSAKLKSNLETIVATRSDNTRLGRKVWAVSSTVC
jgi:hypothetical protein